ncbi:MerR family transcriptional regulator [Paenibacillus sp. SI8]|uniref:MerR family transcriptional regulator n=1 Tax=unclassified Paenibacillus TaxID=185978 RepID=UPI00346654A6
MSKITIKQAAEQTGLSEDTLRYYEKIGLLPRAQREQNGHRYYNTEDMKRILFLIRLKSTGMPIQQMSHFLQLALQGDTTASERHAMLEERSRAIEAQIESLAETLGMVNEKLKLYETIMKQMEVIR